ncbi:MAG: Holliday junction resolvase RuvX [Oscillospiraceae bacterium]|nr:Holliday junction resolvase RuvX [Oscillospiraceae bacterium]
MRVMAIDYGDAHTGVAISDLTCQLAGYTETVHSRKQEKVAARLKELIDEYEVTELVLGYPKNMDGTAGPRAELAAAFGQTLEEAYGLPVSLWDERRTTIDAHNILLAAGKNGKQRKKNVDAVAAALILEGFLTLKKRGTPLL